MLYIALEKPLPALSVTRLIKGDNTRSTWVQMLHEAFDRTALAGSVASFKQKDELLLGFFHPMLDLQSSTCNAAFCAS